MLCEEVKCKILSVLKSGFFPLAPPGPGFPVPPTGPGFGGYPQQPPAQSYAGGGPAQIPGMSYIRNFKHPRLNQETPG